MDFNEPSWLGQEVRCLRKFGVRMTRDTMISMIVGVPIMVWFFYAVWEWMQTHL